MTGPPIPTSIFRLLHVENLPLVLDRGGLHAPNHTPRDGQTYRTIHNVDIQQSRRIRRIPCGPRGVAHDYVPFYLGPRSPMLLQLHTGRVAGYAEGQSPLIYVVSTAQAVASAGIGFAFSDGHGIAAYTDWYDDLRDLDKVDWDTVYADWWRDTEEDMDRQRRKQAEFLVHQFCPWQCIQRIGVLDVERRGEVEAILADYPADALRPVENHPDWYY